MKRREKYKIYESYHQASWGNSSVNKDLVLNKCQLINITENNIEKNESVKKKTKISTIQNRLSHAKRMQNNKTTKLSSNEKNYENKVIFHF